MRWCPFFSSCAQCARFHAPLTDFMRAGILPPYRRLQLHPDGASLTSKEGTDRLAAGVNAEAIVEQWMRRKLNAARADLGLNWDEVAKRLALIGVETTASSLMTKHSRGSFKAGEYIQILAALGVSQVDLPKELVLAKR